MSALLFFIVLFSAFVGGGWLIGKAFGRLLFPEKKEEGITFIDRSVHYHEHKHINIIDDVTRKRILELKQSKK